MTKREEIAAVLHGESVESFSLFAYTGIWNRLPADLQRDLAEMGLINIVRVYEVVRESVQVETTTRPDGEEVTVWHTPVGDLRSRSVQESGYGSRWTMEHLVKSPEDWEIVEYIIEDTHYLPALETWEQADEEMGEAGVVFTALERMPFQRLWIEWGDIEQVCIALAEQRDLVDRLISKMTLKQQEAWQIVAASGAELVWCPDNLTSDILSPELYRRYGQPYYEAVADTLHPAGKRLVAHMDGHLAALEELIGESPVDVVESFTPPPNGNLALGQALEAWPEKCLWVNPPPAWHLLEPPELSRRVRELVEEAPERRRFAFELSEDLPWDQAPVTLRAIMDTLAEV